jgi:hypothetical protein
MSIAVERKGVAGGGRCFEDPHQFADLALTDAVVLAFLSYSEKTTFTACSTTQVPHPSHVSPTQC